MGYVIEGYFGPRKKLRMKAVGYKRDFKKTNNLPYEQKFAGLYGLCEQAASGEFDAVIIAYPEVLGDTYEEMIISLSLLANAGLLVRISGASPGVSI
jgi:hypothetical protein